MNYLPLVRRAWVHVSDAGVVDAGGPVVQSGTLGSVIRWMRQQPPSDRGRFVVGIQNDPSLRTYRELETIAARTGSLG